MSAPAFSSHYAHAAGAANSPLRRQRDAEDDLEDEEHRRLTEASINAFLEEENVPASSRITMEDITTALVVLSNSVATASASFVAKVALLRLDCFAAVEGELRKEVAHSSLPKASVTADESPLQRPARMSVFGWLRHIYKEEGSASGFLRGGRAELGFVLATFVEEALLVAALRSLMKRLGPLMLGKSGRAGGAAASWWMRLSLTVAPTLVLSLLSWPLRTVRTTIRVNYMADTTLPVCQPSRQSSQQQEERQQRRPYRYASATEVWKCVLPQMGIRSLLMNGLDVDLANRVLSLGLAWTVVQPASRWMRYATVMNASTAGAASAPSVLLRLRKNRLFAWGLLLAVAGLVNALQRPFVVLRQRMALLPAVDAESVCNDSDAQFQTPTTVRRGCRYATGWDCAVQVWRREGVAGLFAGLPLCLLTSSVVPLLRTFAGYPAIPSFSGAVV
ncbi:hypothetical protein NXY56_001744 [Leishmania guyanensis]|uniref:Mitochondrial carrier protein n=1 Tax=Leishmania guyanensis TaxID=5670 RepID=A0A1E1IS11_LEIGU|nr:hypothetical protein, conserved [Leishmania guyanensis]